MFESPKFNYEVYEVGGEVGNVKVGDIIGPYENLGPTFEASFTDDEGTIGMIKARLVGPATDGVVL